ncbi:hypothetical protein ACWIEX_08620 [Bosea sp. NPDC055353]
MTSEKVNPTCAKNAQVQIAPAEMSGEREIAELLVSERASLATPQNTARAILALFAPILAEKERLALQVEEVSVPAPADMPASEQEAFHKGADAMNEAIAAAIRAQGS